MQRLRHAVAAAVGHALLQVLYFISVCLTLTLATRVFFFFLHAATNTAPAAAAKYAIRESIEKTYERAKAREAAGTAVDAMEDDVDFDVSRAVGSVTHAYSPVCIGQHCS